MPCRCSGVRQDKCKCQLVSTGFPIASGTGFPLASETGFPLASGTGFPFATGTGFPFASGTGGEVLVLSQKKSACCFHPYARPAKRSVCAAIMESMYDKCAGYNLRYCPFRGSINSGNCLNLAIKDVAVLLCFLLANFVVFLTIMTRMTLHVSALVLQSMRWVRRCLLTKEVINSTNIVSNSQYSRQQPRLHNFTPPSRRN